MSHRTLLLASLLLAASASTALAQPSATSSAPQTHAWDDVSHVNGQVVPVGESNSYLKQFRRTNVSANPLGWIVGIYGVSASYGINNHVAVRGDVTVYNVIDSDTSGIEVSAGVPLYLRRTYQGAFLEPGFAVRSMTDDECAYSDSCGDATVTAGPQMLFGWHWTWDSGFNVAAAAGLGRNLNHEEDEYGYDTAEEVFFNGYFRIGYAF